VGRPRRRERPSLFLSYPPSRPPLSPPASPFVSSIHRARSYDLHPSCLAELPLSLPLRLFLALFPRPLTCESSTFGNESRFQRCLSTSSYSYCSPQPSTSPSTLSSIRRHPSPDSSAPSAPCPGILQHFSTTLAGTRRASRDPIIAEPVLSSRIIAPMAARDHAFPNYRRRSSVIIISHAGNR